MFDTRRVRGFIRSTGQLSEPGSEISSTRGTGSTGTDEAAVGARFLLMLASNSGVVGLPVAFALYAEFFAWLILDEEGDPVANSGTAEHVAAGNSVRSPLRRKPLGQQVLGGGA